MQTLKTLESKWRPILHETAVCVFPSRRLHPRQQRAPPTDRARRTPLRRRLPTGAAVKARPREQHLVVQTVKFGRDLMTSRRIFLVERQIREKPLFRNDVHDETRLGRMLK